MVGIEGKTIQLVSELVSLDSLKQSHRPSENRIPDKFSQAILTLSQAPSQGTSATAHYGIRTVYLLVPQSSLEKSQKGCQAEAVHVVNFGQVGDDEVHLAGAVSQGKVGIPLLQTRGWKGSPQRWRAPATLCPAGRPARPTRVPHGDMSHSTI